MKLPDSVKAVRDAYVKKFPVPHIPPATPDTIDDALREWAIRLAQQVRFATKDPKWGTKRADPGRPISKDSIAFLDGTVLHMWDLLKGASAGNGEINDDPDSLDVPIYPLPNGQTFVPVDPLDSLGSTPPPPPAGTPLADYIAFGHRLDQIYFEELDRHLSDNEAVPNWVFHWRENGRDDAWIRARIRESPEWHQKHPNG